MFTEQVKPSGGAFEKVANRIDPRLSIVKRASSHSVVPALLRVLDKRAVDLKSFEFSRIPKNKKKYKNFIHKKI